MCDSSSCRGDEAGHHCDLLERVDFAGDVDEDMLAWAASPRSTLDIPNLAVNPVDDRAWEVIASLGALGAGWGDDDDDEEDDDDFPDDLDDEDEDDLDDDDLDG